MSIEAVQHIRRMRGGAQSHLMRCSDDKYYVVKFQNNPQHLRVLVNEMLATRLAVETGLPMPATEVVEVGEWLIDKTPDLHIQLAHSLVWCTAGNQFGSRYVVDPRQGQVFDYMPAETLRRLKNVQAFAGALVFDKWTGNTDGRQAAFWKHARERTYSAAFIDQGYCFNAGGWTFPDFPLRGVYANNEVYAHINGWNSFEPWLTRVESMSESRIWEIANDIPCEWYSGDRAAFQELISTTIARRNHVRDLIQEFRCSSRRPFPQWADA